MPTSNQLHRRTLGSCCVLHLVSKYTHHWFYTSLFFGHAEGDKVAEKMYDSMLVKGLPVNKLATLIRDGPNVNKTIFRKVNERISQDHPNFPGLVDLGSCTIHIVHNAFGKALEKYDKDIDQLCTNLHSLFKHSTARCEDFKELQIEMDLELYNFHQHTEVQWLSIGPAIKRILEQWKAITQFVADLTKDPKKVPTGVSFKRVYAMIGTREKAVTRVALEFLNSVIPLFEKFLLMFQKGSPVIHILYGCICDILVKLMRRFLIADAIEQKYGSNFTTIECSRRKLQLLDKELVIGDSTRQAFKDLTHD